MAGSYSTIGPYKSGVWLVSAPDGTGAVLPKNLLPAQGTGYKYYWLGSTEQQATTRIFDAIPKLNIKTTETAQNIGNPVRQAFAGQPGKLDKELTGLNLILHQVGEAAIIPPLGNIGAALSGEGAGAAGAAAGADAGAAGAGAGAGADAGAAGAAAGAAGSAASGLEIAAAIAGVWSFLTAPSSWLRILKYLAGAILIFFGLKELTGVQLPAAAKRVLP